jgi:16S rRNA (guanine527-N7)-methyltransferase
LLIQTDTAADAADARATLARLIDASALSLPDGALDRLESFVRLLLEANLALNLTRVVAPDEVARRHLLDSLAALPILDGLAPGRAMDLGSGGGIPGLVLAVARPGVRWTLADSVRKKADAVRAIADTLELNAEVLAERAEAIGHDPAHRASYDLVTARAVAALPVLVEYALPFLRAGGTLLAWKGRVSDYELAGGARASALLGGSVPEVRPAGWPEALGDHRFVIVRKVGPTPDRYPRRPGEPARRPLG